MDFLEYRLREHYGRLPRPPRAVVVAAPAPTVVAEVAERAFVLTPATKLGVSIPTNAYTMGLSGRFVGAEKANRNNAFWATEDLEFGLPSVVNGPLNWLHQGRHIVGSLTRAEMAQDESGPHIRADATMWKWLWPDEVEMVTAASEAGKLWYSMECVSREVACLADGCGRVYDYMTTVADKAACCSHIQERSAARRFSEPVFLGGAVIVPPVNPGWADADLRVKAAAEELAATTADVRSGASDEEWVHVMAAVVSGVDPA